LRRLSQLLVGIFFVAGLSVVGIGTTAAATSCVAVLGNGGCMSSIQAAVDAAAPGDTITVGGGTFAESVSITKSLTLQGSTSGTTIDATGKDHGIQVSGTSNVTVSGFTVMNAGLSGIAVMNSSNVNVSGNSLLYNDKNLTPQATCPGAPGSDQDDCGAALYVSGVTNSTFDSNIIQHNADGVLVTDETGPSSGNTFSHNTITLNGPECGLTLASHNGTAPNGVFNNTVSNNDISGNGASGVGIFSPFPGTAAYNNVVSGNTLFNNGHAGVTLHTHAPGTNDNNNQIINNTFGNNNTKGDDSAQVGVTTAIILSAPANPITGTVITGNTINDETIGIYLGNATGSTISDNTNNAIIPVLTVPGGSGGVPSTAVSASAYAWPTSSGLTTAFAVSFNSATAGNGQVLFGTSCSGLTGTATEDAFAGTTSHWVLVTRDDFSTAGTGLTPGTTYYYAVATVSSSGVTVDNNGGKCYTVTIPSTATTTGPPSPPASGGSA